MIVRKNELFPVRQIPVPVVFIQQPCPQPSVDWAGLLKFGATAAGILMLLDPGCRGQCRRIAQSLLG